MLTYLTLTGHLNLTAGYWCPIMHWLNFKACANVKNGQLKAIEVALRLSRRRVHALMFEVRFYFQSLITKKPIIKEAPTYLGHVCPAIRFICTRQQHFYSNKGSCQILWLDP